MISDTAATACPSPQVQKSLEGNWDRFHPVPTQGHDAPPVMPFDGASLILNASYNALGNEALLRLVDLETKVRIPVSD